MNNQLIFVAAVEAVLICMTLLFLLQPGILFSKSGPRARRVFALMGQLFLCLLFCWSIILGCVLYVNGLGLPLGTE